jgi:elongator complex protein 4
LLRYYAAEGIVQGHAVTVIGMGEHWVRELPAVVGDAELELSSDRSKRKESERMKIAWRYERLGEFGSGIGGSRAQRAAPTSGAGGAAEIAATKQTFCHAFDLTKRLTIPAGAKLSFLPPPPPRANLPPFAQILARLESLLKQSSPDTVHRVVIPSLLNPALYPPHAALPQHLLQFFHALRALLRRYPKQLTVMISLPTELYPRDTGLIRWLEILSDGVIELLPLPRRTASKGTPGQEEPQGLVKLWKLPVLGEKGGGVGAALGAGEDLAFLVTRRRFEIMAYSLPPADEEEAVEKERGTKVDLEF